MKGFFRLLTTAKSFALFTGALAVSLVALFNDIGPVWMPMSMVAIYTVALAYAQRIHLVALNSTVKDSPYFLGFILTMATLTKIFADIAASRGSSPIPVATIVGDAGAAILATVVGLFGRQLLLSLDPLEHDRDQQFQTIAQQVRDSTAEFHRTQRRFVGLVEEFVSVRERLFAREEAAAASYVQRLESHNRLLSRLEQEYPDRIAAVATGFESAVSSLHEGASEGSKRVARMTNEIASVLADEARLLSEAIEKGNRVLATERDTLGRESKRAEVVYEQLIRALQQKTEEAAAIAASLPGVLNEASGSLAKFGGESTKAQAELEHLQIRLRSWSDSVAASERLLTEKSTTLAHGIDQRAEALKADIQKIDQIVDELVSVLRKRMQAATAF